MTLHTRLEQWIIELAARMPIHLRYNYQAKKSPLKHILSHELGSPFLSHKKRRFRIHTSQSMHDQLTGYACNSYLSNSRCYLAQTGPRAVPKVVQSYQCGDRDLR
jgi:hypothetical protein